MGTKSVIELGRLLGDATRIALLDALFDGRAYTVTELAGHVGAATSTTSEHLSKLLDGGLVAVEPQGRHRYYRLSGPEAANLLETFFEFGATQPVKRANKVPADVAFARTCYDHLAGTIAVGLTDQFVASGLLRYEDLMPTLTSQGQEKFESLGLTLSTSRSSRPNLRRCLDWSERRPHLAGALPAGLLRYLLEERWFVRRPTGRALELTASGRVGLLETFGYQAP